MPFKVTFSHHVMSYRCNEPRRNMQKIEEPDAQSLRSFLDEIESPLKVLFFSSEGSSECTQINDVLNELVTSGDYVHAKFLKMDAEQHEDICRKLGISSVPSVIFELGKGGKESNLLVGADVPNLVKMLKSYHSKAESFASEAEKELNAKLERLINKAPCMLFMKGNPDNPRCGFSKQVIALLNSHNAKYETFDILEDFSVRQGLKTYSNWPTYPQLYVNGELIGGIDILKELSENGELDTVLPKK